MSANHPNWPETGSNPVAEAARPAHVSFCSPFVKGLIDKHPDWLEQLQHNGRLDETSPPRIERLREWLAAYGLEDGLRSFRNQEMMRIIWREHCGLAPLGETMADLSTLAELSLQAAIDETTFRLVEKFGPPQDKDGRSAKFAVIGLGKLGGCELNVSSDIDVVFCYSAQGQCDGPRSLSNEEFFSRLARRVIAMLSDARESGFVFRVDTRLRPFGNAGPLASSIDAMEQYYQREGRDWERYALIKARPVAGDTETAEILISRLQPFVYRRYIDFGAIESLREMQSMVRADTARADREGDIKRGRGGIREIEFIAQGFQLLRGGREPSLRTHSLGSALDAILGCDLLPEALVEELREHYALLRHVENRIQAMRDQQTHQIPSGEDLERLWKGMGLSGQQEFEERLNHTRNRVAAVFDDTWSGENGSGRAQAKQEFSRWESKWLELKASAGQDGLIGKDREIAGFLGPFLAGLSRRPIGNVALARLDRFMPMLLHKLDQSKLGDEVIVRLLDLVLVVVQRSAYLALLTENPAALDRTIALFAQSQWVASRVSRYPELLDELIDPSLGKHISDRSTLDRSISRKLKDADEESALASLNYLKQSHCLRVAVAFIEGRLDAPAVQLALTQLAESMITASFHLAANTLREKHGAIDGDALVVGYGSLGAHELGFESDLDIVFLYQSGPDASSGPRPLAPERWFSRLAQRTVAMLSATTPSGKLYEIDTRLRPNGRAGLLVSTIDSYDRYQMEEAWTWELQALTRARPVVGSDELAGQFEDIRTRALCRARDGDALRSDLIEMRARIKKHEDPRASRLKHMPGGLIDIGFVIQTGALALAHEHPQVIEPRVATKQLEALAEAGWLSETDSKRVQRAMETLQTSRISNDLEIEGKGKEDAVADEDLAWLSTLLESIPIL